MAAGGSWSRLAALDILCKASMLDSDLAIEMAVLATGLLTASQLPKRQRRRESQQCESLGAAAANRRLTASAGIFARCRSGCSIALGWGKGVAWTSACAYGGLILVRVGRWALLLFLHAAPDRLFSLPSSQTQHSHPLGLTGTTTPASGLLPWEEGDQFNGHGGSAAGEGGYGAGGCPRGVPASDESLAAAVAVAVAAAAVCYTLTGVSLIRRLLGKGLVRVPFGLAAELLRAGCIAASSEIVLALISSGLPLSPPSSTVLTSEPPRTTSGEGGGTVAAVAILFLLGVLRVLACASAGAAVSCVGGAGDLGGTCRGSGSGSGTGDAGANADACAGAVDGVSRAGRDNDCRDGMARESAMVPQKVTLSWSVPSGALGGAFYALTAGEVFGGAMREYVLGDEWFSSQSSVRAALAVVFAVVHLLRSLTGPGEGEFNPLAPCYRLLGLGKGATPSPMPRHQFTGEVPGGTAISDAAAAAAATAGAGAARSPPRSEASFKSRDGHDGTVSGGGEGLGSSENETDVLPVDPRGSRRPFGAGREGDDEEEEKDGENVDGEEEGVFCTSGAGGFGQQQQQQQREQREESISEGKLGNAPILQKEVVCSPSATKYSIFPAGVEGISRHVIPKGNTNAGWWRGSGAAGDFCVPRDATPVISECTASWGLPSPAAAAAAATAVSSSCCSGSNDGKSAMSSFPSNSSARCDVSGGGDCGGGSARGSERAAAGGAATTARRRASLPPSSAAPGEGSEDRRRSSGGLPVGGGRLRSSKARDRRAGIKQQAGAGPPPAATGAGVLAVGAAPEGRLGGGRGGGGGGGVLDAPAGEETVRACAVVAWLRVLETWALPAVVLTFLVRQMVVTTNRDFWLAEALGAWVSVCGESQWRVVLDGAGRALTLRFRLGIEAGILSAVVAAAARVRRLAEKVSLVPLRPGLALGPLLTCLGAFGGDVVATLLTGTRSMVLTEESIWPASVAAWVVVGGRPWGSTAVGSAFGLGHLLSLPVAHHSLVFLSEAFRAMLVCRAVDAAREVGGAVLSTSTAAAEVPVDNGIGWTFAVLAGALAGCGGIFFLHLLLPSAGPRGLSPLSTGVPWAVQSALYGSACYCYCCCRCSGVLADHAQAWVSMFFISVALMRTTRWGGGRRFNPLFPIHRVMYLVLGVEGPPPPLPAPLRRRRREVGAERRRDDEAGAIRESGGDPTVAPPRSSPVSVAADRVGPTPAAAATAFAAGGGCVAAGPGMAGTADQNHRRSSSGSVSGGGGGGTVPMGSPNRRGRGRGRGSRGSSTRPSGPMRSHSGRGGRGFTWTALLADGAATAWGRGGGGARGLGRSLLWTVVTAGIIGVSRLLALSTTAIERSYSTLPQHSHCQKHLPPPETLLGFYAPPSVDTTIGIGAARARARAGKICSPESGPGLVKGGGGEEASGNPLVLVDRRDLVGLEPQQLIEQVLAAREAAAAAGERADAAERALAQGGVLPPTCGRRPGGAHGGGTGDGLQFRADNGNGGTSGGGSGEGHEVEPPPSDNVPAEYLARRQLAFAMEDFSSAVREFSGVSRAWSKEVAGGHPIVQPLSEDVVGSLGSPRLLIAASDKQPSPRVSTLEPVPEGGDATEGAGRPRSPPVVIPIAADDEGRLPPLGGSSDPPQRLQQARDVLGDVAGCSGGESSGGGGGGGGVAAAAAAAAAPSEGREAVVGESDAAASASSETRVIATAVAEEDEAIDTDFAWIVNFSAVSENTGGPSAPGGGDPAAFLPIDGTGALESRADEVSGLTSVGDGIGAGASAAQACARDAELVGGGASVRSATEEGWSASARGNGVDAVADVRLDFGDDSPDVSGGATGSIIKGSPSAQPDTDTDIATDRLCSSQSSNLPVDESARIAFNAAAAAAVAAGEKVAFAVAPTPTCIIEGSEPAAAKSGSLTATAVPVGVLLGAAWSAPPSWVRPNIAGGGSGSYRVKRSGVGGDIFGDVDGDDIVRRERGPRPYPAVKTADDSERVGDGHSSGQAETRAKIDNVIPVVSGISGRSPALIYASIDVGRWGDNKLALPSPEKDSSIAGVDHAAVDLETDGGEGVGREGIGNGQRGHSHGVDKQWPFSNAEPGSCALSSAPATTAPTSLRQAEVPHAAKGDGTSAATDIIAATIIKAEGGGSSEQTGDASPLAIDAETANPTGEGTEDLVSAKSGSETTNGDSRIPSVPARRRPPLGPVEAAGTAVGEERPREGGLIAVVSTDSGGGGVGGLTTVTALSRSGGAGGEPDNSARQGVSGGSGEMRGSTPVAGHVTFPGYNVNMYDDEVSGEGDAGGGGGGDGDGGDDGSDQVPGVGGRDAAAAATAVAPVREEIGVPAGVAVAQNEKEEWKAVGSSDAVQDEAASKGENGVISAAESKDEAEMANSTGRKGWWARRGDRRRAKAKQRALKQAQELSAAESKQEFEQLQESKRLAILAAEERERELRLLEEAQLQTASGRERDSSGRNPTRGAAQNSGAKAANATDADASKKGGAPLLGGATEPVGRGSSCDQEPSSDTTDGDSRGSGGGEASGRSPPAPSGAEEREQGQQEPAGTGKRGGKGRRRLSSVLGVIAAAAYYVAWAAVALALG